MILIYEQFNEKKEKDREIIKELDFRIYTYGKLYKHACISHFIFRFNTFFRIPHFFSSCK